MEDKMEEKKIEDIEEKIDEQRKERNFYFGPTIVSALSTGVIAGITFGAGFVLMPLTPFVFTVGGVATVCNLGSLIGKSRKIYKLEGEELEELEKDEGEKETSVEKKKSVKSKRK